MSRTPLAAALMAALLATSLSAAGNVPGVGHSAPDFTLPGPEGTHQLEAIEGDKAVVLVFFRGLW